VIPFPICLCFCYGQEAILLYLLGITVIIFPTASLQHPILSLIAKAFCWCIFLFGQLFFLFNIFWLQCTYFG
jgi:hypothetical protein